MNGAAASGEVRTGPPAYISLRPDPATSREKRNQANANALRGVAAHTALPPLVLWQRNRPQFGPSGTS